MPVYRMKKENHGMSGSAIRTGLDRPAAQKRGRQKSEAVQYERDFLKKQSGSCDRFGSMVELYMEDCKTRLRSTTYESKKYLIDSKILPALNNLPINAITRQY